jgi:3-dehydroquinate synthase
LHRKALTRHIRVGLPSGSYQVTVGDGILSHLDDFLPESLSGRPIVLITNEVVGRLHGKPVIAALKRVGTVHTITLPDGEAHKTLKTATRIYGELARLGLDRSSVVCALGGGVIGDMAGFVAATYLRGVRFVQIPTTLLAQVDASVGGKVGVNLPEGKNLVGAFHQPVAVIADTKTLATLPERELCAGMMEVVKYALIGDVPLSKYLRNHRTKEWDYELIVEASVRDKARVVAADEREAGHRRVLNLGHTLAHALEAVTRYRSYLHGEAVGIGLVYANLLAQHMRRLSPEVTEEVTELVQRIGLDIRLPRVPFSRIYSYFASDKKVSKGQLHFVLPVGAGRVQVVSGIPDSAFAAAYRSLQKIARG